MANTRRSFSKVMFVLVTVFQHVNLKSHHGEYCNVLVGRLCSKGDILYHSITKYSNLRIYVGNTLPAVY